MGCQTVTESRFHVLMIETDSFLALFWESVASRNQPGGTVDHSDGPAQARSFCGVCGAGGSRCPPSFPLSFAVLCGRPGVTARYAGQRQDGRSLPSGPGLRVRRAVSHLNFTTEQLQSVVERGTPGACAFLTWSCESEFHPGFPESRARMPSVGLAFCTR